MKSKLTWGEFARMAKQLEQEHEKWKAKLVERSAQINAEYMRIMEELDWPPIFLIPHNRFEMIEGEEHRRENMVSDLVVGIAAIHYPVIAVHPWLEGKILTNTIYHEVAHKLWPWRSHWWIEMAAEKLAGGGGRGFYSRKYGKTLDDVPPRDKLLRMARNQARRLRNKKPQI